MSYPRDLDEIPRHELAAEIARREAANERGVCDYCGRLAKSIPCKFRHRHAVTNRIEFLKLNVKMILGS